MGPEEPRSWFGTFPIWREILQADISRRIYGGGYVASDKSSSGNPASLIARSLEDDNEGVVYVAMNYRLGLFVSYSIPLNCPADELSGMAIRIR